MSATPVKLTVPGSSLTMQVEKAAMATVGKFPEMIFTGTNTDTGEYISLALPKSSADRQLGRLSLDMASAAGALLVFSRDPNPSDPAKAYWGVNWGEASNLPAKGPIVAPRASQTARTTAPHHTHEEAQAAYYGSPPPPNDTDAPIDAGGPHGQGTDYGMKVAANRAEKLAAIFDVHRQCFDHAYGLCQSVGITDPATISALTAQAFIQANQGMRGV